MNKIKLAYFGSADFSAYFLEKLLTDNSIKHIIEVKFVVTQPDRPVGRKQITTPTPVKIIAKKYGLEVFDIKNSKIKIKDCGLCLLYAHNEFIQKELLILPKYGFWCLHPSLLPKYRGPSPIVNSLVNGDIKTGMTIIKMDHLIDHGPIIAQESLTIGKTHKRPELEKRLTDLGFQMFIQSINKIDCISLKKQDQAQATYTKKITKQDGFIPFENWNVEIRHDSEKVYNLFRGLYPWPGIWTVLPNGKRLKISDIEKDGEKLIIKKVQLEGKKEVDFKTFNKAYGFF